MMLRTIMSAKAIIRMPGEAKGVTLSGQPLAFLVSDKPARVIMTVSPCWSAGTFHTSRF
jgi:hypothetical protein